MSRLDLPNEKAPNFNARLRETMMTYLGKTGDPLDRGVTMRDLIESGLVKVENVQSLKSGGAVSMVPGTAISSAAGGDKDLTAPPTPEGVVVTGGVAGVFIEHEVPLFSQGKGYYRTHVYGVTVTDGRLPTFTDAVELTQFTGTTGSFASNPATTWRIWLKYESKDGVLSATPAGGTNGIPVTTGQDVSTLLKVLTSELDANGDALNTNAVFIERKEATVVNGVLVPAGVYMRAAFIQNGVIDSAKIGNGAIDSAKIAEAAIASANIQDAAITAAKIQDAAISTAKIEDAAISTAKIADAAISAAKIGDAEITLAKIDTASITNLSSISANMGTITAGKMQSTDGKFVIDLTNKSISITV